MPGRVGTGCNLPCRALPFQWRPPCFGDRVFHLRPDGSALFGIIGKIRKDVNTLCVSAALLCPSPLGQGFCLASDMLCVAAIPAAPFEPVGTDWFGPKADQRLAWGRGNCR